MRRMTSSEKMAVRLALAVEREKLERLAAGESDRVLQASYRKRLSTVMELIRIFGNENEVLFPFEGVETAKAAGASGR